MAVAQNMGEEEILQRAFDIKTSKTSYTVEEKQTIDISDAIIDQRTKVVRGLESTVEELSNKVLREVDDPKNWQPSDNLPDFSGEWVSDIKRIQEQSRALPDALLVVLIGDMITEDGLPTYQTLLNRIAAVQDLTGKQDTVWGRWTRWWTAEEKRHGDLLHTYLRFIPRLNMHAIERDIQHLIGSGFDPGVGDDPYKLMVYTSFQEKATFISHKGTARIAKEKGDERLHTICTIIAGDEARHFTFYKGVMKEIFGVDPNGAMTAYAWMMDKTISMPAKEMDSCRNPTLYTEFSDVAQAIGVYTAGDYADIIEQLNNDWEIRDRQVTTAEANRAQERLLNLPRIYLRVARMKESGYKGFRFDSDRFDWLN